ncbi:MAG: hypothetical protein FWF54_00040 [Candidatus Azobacteroides sp.]|nr:hypothetical protein [Candidatus Azobacteroides sp.]
MDRIDFTQPGGFPLMQDTLAWMQDSYTGPLSGLAQLCGENVIVSGCEKQGNGITEGWLAVKIDGKYELVPMFEAGYTPTVISVTDKSESLWFKDGTEKKRIWVKKYATPTPIVGASQFEWNKFVRLSSLQEAKQNFLDLKNEVASLARIPKGLISMWNGNESGIPDGWVLCDGRWYDPENRNNVSEKEIPGYVYAPNLQGRFIVGYECLANGQKRGNIDYTKPGNTGGEDKHQLTINEMPKHNHIYEATTINFTEYEGIEKLKDIYKDGVDGNDGHTYTYTTTSRGENQFHENRPPYYVLAYIMKL